MRFTKSEILKTLALALIISVILGVAPGFPQGFKGFKGFGGKGFGMGRGRSGYNNFSGKNRIQDMSGDLEELTDPTSTLKPFATVKGVVYGPDGKTPIEGITVTIHREDAKGDYKVPSKKDGSFLYDGLPAGNYVIGVIYKGDQGLPRDAELKNGRVFISDFDLSSFDPLGKAGTGFGSLKDKLGAAGKEADDEVTGKIPSEIQDLYDKAKDAMAKNDCGTATTILKELVAKEPLNTQPAPWRRLGECSLTLKKYEEAVTAFRKTVELMPKDSDDARKADYIGMLSMALLYVDKLDEAETLSEKTAALDKPRGARAYFNLGLALTDKGDGPKAEKAFEKATKLDSGTDNAEAFYQLGLTLLTTHVVPPLKITDAIVPLQTFRDLAQRVDKNSPDAAEIGQTAAIAKELIDEISKPAPGAAKK